MVGSFHHQGLSIHDQKEYLFIICLLQFALLFIFYILFDARMLKQVSYNDIHLSVINENLSCRRQCLGNFSVLPNI